MLTLGVIADDFTGATDVASMLVRAGMRTAQLIGVPDADRAPPPADAIVVALKTRTNPAEAAVRESLAALAWLRRAGMRQCYFKYCSTFDSTPAGNIGPVTDALMDALGADFTLACPAFPENGRTIFRGHLFVGDALLSDSGMRDHPLTPMRDANLVRVLQAQTRRKVGLIRHDAIAQGVGAVAEQVEALRAAGAGIAIADAIDNDALRTLAAIAADWPLVTAGSGLALGLPLAYAERGWVQPDADVARLSAITDPRAALLSGSCSQATLAQVQHWRVAGRPAFAIDPRAIARGEPVAEQALAWADERLAREPVLIYASAAPEALRVVQAELGATRAGEMVEHCLAQIAQALVRTRGVQRLVVAGGETSGAVVNALGITQLRIGATICPGVPWTEADHDRPLHLALKSGNFGTSDFFARALAQDPAP
ncbi:MAG TPA: 3-oxo-tetronate kinase [Burkholderiaceae bacterium]|nr:3-oxo-tetronate kinase [Burkholderiaceae bacterium]